MDRRKKDWAEVQYATIASLEDGWLGPGTRAVPPTILERLRAVLDAVGQKTLPPFCPTEEGHVIFELGADADKWWGCASIEGAEDQQMYLLSVNEETPTLVAGVLQPYKQDTFSGPYNQDAFIAFLTSHTMPGAEDA